MISIESVMNLSNTKNIDVLREEGAFFKATASTERNNDVAG